MDQSTTLSLGVKGFNIRDFMDFQTIQEYLIRAPCEMALLEVTCNIINNKVQNELLQKKGLGIDKKE
tara:strand:+ start:1730 stop:1930 length:201 start_codon:yes stop_codon:yes gene_type:complete